MTNRLGSRTAGRTGARAVVPDYWIAVDESSGCIEFGLSSRDANEGESSREQVNDFINNTDTSFRLGGVYASPTPPASEVVNADDVAVDRFAVAMKEKLAAARAKGRSGWSEKSDCSQEHLSDLLRAHVGKGDPRDVANFCMFLHQRGESITPPASEVKS
jgi:hypothetical protein